MHFNKRATMKRLRLSAAVLALTLAFSAAASAAGVATVTVDKLNVRALPSTDSTIVSVVSKGTQLPLLETMNNGWLKVEVNGSAAYVYAAYTTASGSASGGSQSSGGSSSSGGSQASIGGQTGVVTADRLNVRSGASTSSSVLGTIRNGTSLTVAARSGDWLQINYNGVTAYVSAAYVRLSGGASSGGAASSGTSSSSLSEGSRGSAVKDLQRRLIALGYLSGAADGVFGPMTKAAVAAFQNASGIAADGIAGAQTLLALDSDGAKPTGSSGSAASQASFDSGTILKKGSTGDAVKALQQKLISLGYLSGGADGVFGPATQKAVAAFQAANGLDADGIAGAQTLAALQNAPKANGQTGSQNTGNNSSGSQNGSSAASDQSGLASQAVENTNAERAKNGLSALRVDADLTAAAKIRAKEIAEVFDHVRPDGSSWYTVSSKAAGENLAAGQKSASSVVDAWMNSSSHRDNILNESFSSVGIACVQVGGVNYWVQLFGR